MLKYLTLLFTLIIAIPAFGQTLGGGTVGIPGLTTNAVRERHLKAVDSPADEECLTYEDTVGDFEWQSCISGAVTDVTGTAPIASTGGATPAISITADGIDFTEIADDMTLDGNLTIEAPAADNITIDSRTAPSTHTQGIMRYEHTAAAVNTRVIELEVDAASFASTHAVRADLHATALAPGEAMIGYHVSADTSTSTGGMIEAIRVDKAGAGSADVHALHIGPGIDVIHQETGTFGAIESAWENAVEVTSELNDTGTDLTLFSSNSDILYIGDAATFNELEVNLDTEAGGAGIKPTFEFSNDGAGGWDTFTPVDGTDGFRETGIIEWTIGDLTNWQTDTVNGVANKFWIRITRTQPSIPTDPIEDTIQILRAAEFSWDEDGVIDAANINIDAAIDEFSDFNYVATNPATTVGLDIFSLFNPASASTGYHYGLYAEIDLSVAATETGGHLVGIEGDAYGSSGAAVLSLTGVATLTSEVGASTVTDAFNFRAYTPTITTLTNAYGLYIDDFSSAASAINEAIHVEGGDVNLAASDTSVKTLVTTGIVGIGTPDPDAELEIYSADPTLRLRDSGPTASSTTAFMEFGGTDTGSWVRTGYVGDSSAGDANIMLRAEIGDLHLGDAINNQAIAISSGNISMAGSLDLQDNIYLTAADTLTAGSTQTQAGATVMTAQINKFTVSGTDGDGGALPSAVDGLEIIVINADAAQTIQIWPGVGFNDAIDGGSIDAVDANTLAAGESRTYAAVGTADWTTISDNSASPTTGFTMDSGAQILAGTGSAGAPSYSFAGRSNTGIYSAADNRIDFVTGSSIRFFLLGGTLRASDGAGPGLVDGPTSSTVPTVWPRHSDIDSGVGSNGVDAPNMIAGGVNAVTWTEASGHVIVTSETHVGLTANSGGGGVGSCLQLLSSFNEISVSAAPGDSVCVPTAVVGQLVFIINNGASAVDVYPFTSDNLGGGVDTAVSLPAGSNTRYFAIDGVNWEVM